jgi:type II restriction/modification system DNA methylase subunit YeeA
METAKLKKFAQAARRSLIGQVQAKLGAVLAEGSAERREYPKAVEQLEKELADLGKEQLVEKVAYVWFNRLSALRFMDANSYNRIRIVSPAEDRTQPEILAEALGGYIDGEMVPSAISAKVSALLDGSAPSRDPQGEAYRLLLVAACNFWHRAMPFLFEAIADYSELLMPEGLLAPDSLLVQMREVMTEEACQDVEIIGWLYQFYISEKKDEVFAGLKKNKKITAENIPAATQLFTPHWIVRYLVENSLGRLWMLNHPDSKLVNQMDYYIAPEEPETDFLKISTPQDIKLCDPACGSGHMLTYAFDLLYAIYEEEGYDPSDIPSLILTKNLTGIEIDERAGELAAFALTMKARAKQRRFFGNGVQPNINVLQNVSFTDAEMEDVQAVVGKDLFTDELRETLTQFEQAKNFGSLIVPALRDPAETLRVVEAKDFADDLLLSEVQDRVMAILEMAEALSPKYRVVVANPPYMGSGGMNGRLQVFAKDNFPISKIDLYAMFMERSLSLTQRSGFMAMINMQSWMFLSSFSDLRSFVTDNCAIVSMAHLGSRAFDSISGEVVSTTAFVFRNECNTEREGTFIRLVDGKSEKDKSSILKQSIGDPMHPQRFTATSRDFLRIPTAPIAYWFSEKIFQIFQDFPMLKEVAPTKQGLATGDNEQFLRQWSEVVFKNIAFDCDSSEETLNRSERWYPCNKGGEYRKWFGNNYFVVDWEGCGRRIKNLFDNKGKLRSRPQNEGFYFKSGLTWSAISSSGLSMRFSPDGYMFETKGAMCFPSPENSMKALAFLNSPIVYSILKALSPTLDFHEGPVGRLPFKSIEAGHELGKNAVDISRKDWDAYEASWDFSTLPLLSPDHRGNTLNETYDALRDHWQGMTDEMKRLEEENNRVFIDAYGLQDELNPDVPIEEITLTCNPAYRYGGKKTEDQLEELLCADTMKEFISYAVGCMFGRYAIDKPRLILANQGETIEDYRRLVPDSRFEADDDNVIPMLDGDWFSDDITERFRTFLRVTFGETKFAENLRFIEESIGKSLRQYFLRDFYNDHIKRYKKRPIYWLFSSPKGSFNALIYMHRYRPDTISVILNDYLREYRSKLSAERGNLENLKITGTSSEKTRAEKRIDQIDRIIEELDDYERETLYPLATEKLDIDLDDGVKVNYAKFGDALKPIKGLNA